MNDRTPVICAEFAVGGEKFQVVLWPEKPEGTEFDVVRAHSPFVWRSQALYSEEFGVGQADPWWGRDDSDEPVERQDGLIE